MPRQAPNQVIEHRLSLQDAERAALLPLLNDVQSLTNKYATAAEVGTYGALALGGLTLIYVPQLWAHVREREGGLLNPGDTIGERFRWVMRWTPAGITSRLVGDLLGIESDSDTDGTGFDWPSWWAAISPSGPFGPN